LTLTQTLKKQNQRRKALLNFENLQYRCGDYGEDMVESLKIEKQEFEGDPALTVTGEY